MSEDSPSVKDSPPAPSDPPQPYSSTQRQSSVQVTHGGHQSATQTHDAPLSALGMTTAQPAQTPSSSATHFTQGTHLNPQNTGQAIYPAHGAVYTGWQGPPMAGNYPYPAYNAIPSMQWQQGALPYMPQMYGSQQLPPQLAQQHAYSHTNFRPYQEVGFPQQYHLRGQAADGSDRRPSRGSSTLSSPQNQQYPAMTTGQLRPIDSRATQTHQLSQVGRARPNQHQVVDDSRKAPRQPPVTVTRSTPSYPRGPPRKPKQSGFALWVGNLPPRTDILELKDHFSRDATQDIESVFLISKSNCAFVNYRTEEACKAAMTRFDAVRFRGAQLVCRIRQSQQGALDDANAAAVSNVIGEGGTTEGRIATSESISAPGASLGPSSAQIAAGVTTSATDLPLSQPKEGFESDIPTEGPMPVSASPLARYFIVKSLTSQDLDASVRDGIWATQSHNEQALNDAYQGGQTVYLIFSANKSGEYYGYARMASAVDTQSITINPRLRFGSGEAEEPTSRPTPARAHAPKGRVVDDSARGTIFWEAENTTTASLDEAAEANAATKDMSKEAKEQDWGKPFKVEWLCTIPLPFYKTKGLRNPWNSNREVKIARDGTELEPSVGRTLLGMFDRPVEPGPTEYTVAATR